MKFRSIICASVSKHPLTLPGAEGTGRGGEVGEEGALSWFLLQLPVKAKKSNESSMTTASSPLLIVSRPFVCCGTFALSVQSQISSQ